MSDGAFPEPMPYDVRRRRMIVHVLFLAVFLTAMLATALHTVALANLSASHRFSHLDSRLGAARRASMIEPWNEQFRVRVATLRAENLLSKGRPEEARRLLEPFDSWVDRDADFARAYERARTVAP